LKQGNKRFFKSCEKRQKEFKDWLQIKVRVLIRDPGKKSEMRGHVKVVFTEDSRFRFLYKIFGGGERWRVFY
jgi:hypothetical protein